MLAVWRKLKKALSFKPKANNSLNEAYDSKSPASPPPSSSLSCFPESISTTTRSPKKTCVICLRSMKAEDGKALFTAECRHSFHFRCITKNVKHGNHVCPICRCKWKEIPFQFATRVNVARQHVSQPINILLPIVPSPHPQPAQFGIRVNVGRRHVSHPINILLPIVPSPRPQPVQFGIRVNVGRQHVSHPINILLPIVPSPRPQPVQLSDDQPIANTISPNS